jgi:two-component system, sensor histidine kinase and response regulator
MSPTDPRPPDTAPPIDRRTIASLREAIGEIAPVIAMALEDIPARLVDLRLGVETLDCTRVRDQAHTLAGAVANLGAREFVRLARALDVLGRSGDLDGAPGLLAALEAETARLLPALVALAHEENGAPAERPPC